jgi:hypothetical protein
VTTVQENGVSWRVENANQEKAGGKEVQTAGTAEIACTVNLFQPDCDRELAV